jgi:hypothetical protein
MDKVLTYVLLDGDPYGIKIINEGHSSEKIFVIPRAKLKSIKDRDEANFPALYFLFGDVEDETKPGVYIGETENFYKRLIDHESKKTFWEWAVVFVGGLDKADVRYLENKAVQEAVKIDRYIITNENSRNENMLSESKKITADGYFSYAKFVMAVLGYKLFESVPKDNHKTEDIYCINNNGIEAKGALLDTGEFIIFKGSTARLIEVPSLTGTGSSKLRQLMSREDDGRLKKISDDAYQFTDDVIFTSPSLAATVVIGRSSNGWIYWKDEQGKTLDENKRK